MEQNAAFYLCDPEKHTACKKTGCMHDPDAVYRRCKTTVNPAFAKLDEQGQPIRLPDGPEPLSGQTPVSFWGSVWS